jgi:hypothetical protein
MDAKRAKNKALRERRLERKEAKRDALISGSIAVKENKSAWVCPELRVSWDS